MSRIAILKTSPQRYRVAIVQSEPVAYAPAARRLERLDDGAFDDAARAAQRAAELALAERERGAEADMLEGIWFQSGDGLVRPS